MRIIEQILFCLVLAVIALRATFTEGPGAISTHLPTTINDTVYSLSLSLLLIFSFLLWLIIAVWRSTFTYRRTAIEIPLLLFIAAAALAACFASDKRAAVTSSVLLIAPLLMTVLLTQLLDSRKKIIILLIAIAALGLVNAWQSAEQSLISNDILIEQYESDPQTILKPLGIQPGSLNHILLEHRLYSKGVRGFFTTSNSAGSFAILASFAALALFLIAFKNRKDTTPGKPSVVFPALAFLAVLFALLITKSKGALAASAIGLLIFLALIRFGAFFLAHRKPILLVSLILALAAALAVAAYGIKHDRLPGGNSMLVRWQYFSASAKMFADHPLTGTGPGNFAVFYTQYKPPAASETVSDPHCFALSILTQFGPLGLIAFLALFLIPLAKTTTYPKLLGSDTPAAKLALYSLAPAVLLILLVRPLLMPASTADKFDEKLYVIFTSYAVPAIAFALGCWLFSPAIHSSRNTKYAIRNTKYEIRDTNVTVAALFAAILALLIHNLIDFAIFEPPVFTTLCAALACLIALNSSPNTQYPIPNTQYESKIPHPVKLLVTAAAILAAHACLNYALLPVAKSTAKISYARDVITTGQFELAHNLLDAAANDDPLSPDAPALNARFYLDESAFPGPENSQTLLNAEQALYLAVDRNPADYKNFQILSQMYLMRAENTPLQKHDLLNKALYCASTAVELYPGSAHLRINLAKIAEQTGQTDTALEHYKKALDIEDAFRRQFHTMYPDAQPFSRLGFDKYNLAREQIKQLTQ